MSYFPREAPHKENCCCRHCPSNREWGPVGLIQQGLQSLKEAKLLITRLMVNNLVCTFSKTNNFQKPSGCPGFQKKGGGCLANLSTAFWNNFFIWGFPNVVQNTVTEVAIQGKRALKKDAAKRKPSEVKSQIEVLTTAFFLPQTIFTSIVPLNHKCRI